MGGNNNKPYEMVTQAILELLDKGVIPWRQTWADHGAPKSLATGKPYRGCNVFLLACLAALRDYESPYWATFNQVKERGGHVRKGSKGVPVVFWKVWKKERENEETGETEELKLPVLRYYTVFNADQCEGIEVPAPEAIAEQDFTPIEACERVIAEMPRPPTLEHRGYQPCYSLERDTVVMPKPEYFQNPTEYYAALFHEEIHGSGHSSRLNRNMTGSMRTPAYAREELVAEMGSAFLCGHCGIEKPIIANAAAYIQSWRKRLTDDSKLIVMAGAQAQKAADYILNLGDRDHEMSEQNGTTPTEAVAVEALASSQARLLRDRER